MMHESIDEAKQWTQIAEGVSCARLSFDEPQPISISVSPKEMLWVTASEGQVACINTQSKSERVLRNGESSLLIWPRSPWTTLFKPSAGQFAEAAIFKISFVALHDMLAVDFSDDQESNQSFSDLDRLSVVVHFSPVRVRDIGRIFIHSHDSRFRSMARRGIFYDIFSEMLEKIYGTDMAQCPFQIDAETERKIRQAREMIIESLNSPVDLGAISAAVELPKPVLREGFQFIFGTNMQGYINEYKFDMARVMLESGKYLIKEIAFEMGYQNPSHFISSFKQRYGITPKQWVKQQVTAG